MTTRRRLTPAQKAEIVEEQGGMCFLCHEPLEGPTDYDHVLPLALGGADSPENICAVHRDPCHREKSKQDVSRIRKADRQKRYLETGKPRKARGRPLQGRGFSKTLRRKMSGEVVPR